MSTPVVAIFHLMRLHRPWPILLALFPTLWGLWLAQGGMPPLGYLFIFVLGTVLMRSAGCVINDFFDVRLDATVSRTKGRVLVQKLVSKKTALLVFGVLIVLAASLLLFLNWLTFCLAIVALFWTVLYPLTKRFFWMPQLILGIAFNFGLLMAFAAIQNTLPLRAWLWFLLAILWTLIYDTDYALSDRIDDLRAGIHSSAVLFAQQVRAVIGILQASMTLFATALLWPLYAHKTGLALVVLILIGLFFHEQRLLKKKQYLRAFHHHIGVGFVLLLAIIAGVG